MPKKNVTGGVKAKTVGVGATLGVIQPWEREERKAGGRVYPAKRLNLLEKAAMRAHKELAESSKPLMDMPDEHIAHGLNMAQKG